MLTIEESRKLVDGDEEYSDEQIVKIKDDCYALGQLAFDCWLEEK